MSNCYYEQVLKQNDFNMLDIIFNARAEELSKLLEKDVKVIDNVKIRLDADYAKFKNNLNKIPSEYQEIKREVIDAFNEYTDSLEYREGYFNEKYYKEGFKDGINIIIKCFNR